MVLQILFLGPSNLLEPNASFAQMSQKLIVSPIVKTLVFSKVPEKVHKLVQFRLLFLPSPLSLTIPRVVVYSFGFSL